MPVEPWEIDQDHTVDLATFEASFGDVCDPEEFAKLRKDLGDPHDSHAGQIEIKVQSSLDHLRSTKTAHSRRRIDALEALDQIRCMQIPTGLSHRKEDPLSHSIVAGIG